MLAKIINTIEYYVLSTRFHLPVPDSALFIVLTFWVHSEVLCPVSVLRTECFILPVVMNFIIPFSFSSVDELRSQCLTPNLDFVRVWFSGEAACSFAYN